MISENRRDLWQTKRLIVIARRRLWIILPCIFIGGLGAFAEAKSQTPKYSATAALLFQQNTLSQQLFGYSGSPVIDPTTLNATNLSLVTQPAVALATARALGVSQGRVSGEVSASAVGSSNVVDVTATDASPAYAATMANAYVNRFIAYRVHADRAQVIQATVQLERQIARLRQVNGRANQIANLQTRLSQLEVLKSLQTGDVQLAQPAQVPTSPSSPKTKQDVLVGIMAGLLIGLLAAALAQRIDQKLREPDEIRDIMPLPVLGAIPASRALSRASVTKPSESAAEADSFRLLRTQLRYFNVDRAIRSVLITSAAPGDGKSTVAWNLARAAASVAADPGVLLVDADLRRPMIEELAQLPPGPGLVEVLTQDLAVKDAVRHVPIEAPNGDYIGELHVLTAGGGAPNPAELMESNKLRRLVADLHERYDFVVFDAPPTSLVSDAIPLMTQVSGLLVVVRLRRTPRASLRRLAEQIADVHAHALGLVLNDIKQAESGYYGYYGDYGHNSNGNGPSNPKVDVAGAESDRSLSGQ
jgi:capsular exopolysaccharide synthesis family protein